MKKFKSLLTLMSVVFVLTCVTVSVSGQVTDEDPKLASISGSGSVVRWQVNASYVSITITVAAPDGQVFRKQLKEGSATEFALFDKEGKALPDGVYSYELRLTQAISSDVKAKLAASRVNTDDDAATEREMRKSGALPPPLVQSGTFAIMKGSAVVYGAASEDGRSGIKIGSQTGSRIAAANSPRRNHHRLLGLNPDQVIPDDLIVQGSLCVGFDCVNNESFSFDTIRMKENNTRIKFDDTSTTAGFPANDWQLTANDSASGGQSKFSIEDITGARVPFTVEAGATTNSIYVDSTGRVGFRTSTPVLDLHVNTSNTPALRLEQNSSGGFTAQTWDVAGNEANFFVRDVTGGSRLPFRIRPGAPTSSIDISADGDVGVGTASPRSRLDLKQSEDSFVGSLQLRRSTTNDTWALATAADNNLYFGYATSASLADANADFAVFPLILTSNDRVGIGTAAPDQKLSVNGDASKVGGGAWLVFSDERLKTIKGSFNSGLKALMQLQPLRYEYKPNNVLNINSTSEHIGFTAQSVMKAVPEAVTKTDQGYLLVNNDPILWTMLNAIKEQQKEIEQLKAEVRKLRTTSRRRR